MTARAMPKCFGLIGGLGMPSTLYYYQALTRAYAERGIPARFFVANADFDHVLGLIAAKDHSALADYFATLIRSLALAGAEYTALSAVMPHVCIPELVDRSLLPVVDIVEVLKQHLAARHIERVALLGTRVTMTSRLFGRLPHLEVLDLTAQTMNEVQRIYTSIQLSGSATPEDTVYLKSLGQRLHNRGAQAIVVAGTDLTGVLKEDAELFPVFDCAKAHIEAIVERALPRLEAVTANQ